MVLESGLGGTRRERSVGNEVLNELVVLRERRRDVEGNGVLHDESDI